MRNPNQLCSEHVLTLLSCKQLSIVLQISVQTSGSKNCHQNDTALKIKAEGPRKSNLLNTQMLICETSVATQNDLSKC